MKRPMMNRPMILNLCDEQSAVMHIYIRMMNRPTMNGPPDERPMINRP